MRITHLNQRYWPHIGGIERSLHAMARACVRRGDDVSAVVCASGLASERNLVDGVEVLGVPSFGVFQSQPIAPSYLRLPEVTGTVWHLHEPFPLGTLALVVARLVYYKGVDVLLDALALSPCARLVVVGDGPLRDQLSRHAIALGVADRVCWLGTVSDDDLVGAFSAADFFVLPSVA